MDVDIDRRKLPQNHKEQWQIKVKCEKHTIKATKISAFIWETLNCRKLIVKLNYCKLEAWKEKKNKSGDIKRYLMYHLLWYFARLLAFGFTYRNIHRDLKHSGSVEKLIGYFKNREQWQSELKNYGKMKWHFISVQTARCKINNSYRATESYDGIKLRKFQLYLFNFCQIEWQLDYKKYIQ